jgi:hypothetical protein
MGLQGCLTESLGRGKAPIELFPIRTSKSKRRLPIDALMPQHESLRRTEMLHMASISIHEVVRRFGKLAGCCDVVERIFASR